MRILYLSASYLPSRRASSIQVMEMCHAFSREGNDVTLIAKAARDGHHRRCIDLHGHYGLPATFDIRVLPRPEVPGGGLIYALRMALDFKKRISCDLVYCRDFLGAWMATLFSCPFVFEAHQLPPTRVANLLFPSIVGSPHIVRLITITNQLREDLRAKGRVPSDLDVVVAPSAVNPDKLRASPSLLVPKSTINVGYVGNLYEGRGRELILGLASALPGITFNIVGASADSAEFMGRNRPANLILHGFVRPDQVGEFYASFDVLLMPYQGRVLTASGRTDTARWCSPIKLFEYMASGKAIVASDLPVLREILRDGENAVIVPAADLEAWVRVVSRLARDKTERERLGSSARAECLAKYTWEKRARLVLGLEDESPCNGQGTYAATLPSIRPGRR